jgi:hypothetical protein
VAQHMHMKWSGAITNYRRADVVGLTCAAVNTRARNSGRVRLKTADRSLSVEASVAVSRTFIAFAMAACNPLLLW